MVSEFFGRPRVIESRVVWHRICLLFNQWSLFNLRIPLDRIMDYLGYYFIFALAVVLGVVGFECRRLWRKKIKQNVRPQAEQDLEFERRDQSIPAPPKNTRQYCSLTWHHIAPEVRKGHAIRLRGYLRPEVLFEVMIEPRPDLSLRVNSCQIQGESMQHDPVHGCLVSLLPGMHAFLIKDDVGESHLVCGGSKRLNKDLFNNQLDSELIIENFAPRRQVSELRVHYKYEKPDLCFVDPVLISSVTG